MSRSDGRFRFTLRGLTLGASAVVLFVLAGVVWNWGASGARTRDRAYPIPNTQEKKAKSSENKTLQVEARAAAAAEGTVEIALAQLVLGVLGLGGIGFTIYYAHLAWRENQRSASAALDAYRADNRTWVRADAYADGPVVWTEGVPRYTIYLRAKNIGNQPALNVGFAVVHYVAAGFAVGPSARDGLIERQLKTRRGHAAEGAVLLMDGEPQGSFFTADAGSDPVTNARALESNKDVPPENIPIILSATYCVTYKSPASDEWSYTAGVIRVGRKDGAPLDPGGGDIPAQELEARVLPGMTKMT